VLELLIRNPSIIMKIIIKESNSEIIKRITDECIRNNIRVEILSSNKFDNNKSIPVKKSQGVIALTKEFTYVKTSDIIQNNYRQTHSVIVIIDEIQDPHNVGAIIRTCVACGVNGIIMSDKNTPEVNYTVIKASAGAVNYIPVSRERNIYKTTDILKENNYLIIGTTPNTDQLLYDFGFPDKCVIIFGNESKGLRKNVIELCDRLIKIPMYGEFNSLNVSVAAGIVLYEVFRQKKLDN